MGFIGAIEMRILIFQKKQLPVWYGLMIGRSIPSCIKTVSLDLDTCKQVDWAKHCFS